MKARYWLMVLGIIALLAILVNIKVEAAESNTWGLAAINDYIDKANVLVGDESGDFCSGTVISIKNRFILTANHCVEDRVVREEKEFVDPITGEVSTKTIERRLDLQVSKNIVKDYEVVSRQSFTAKIWARDAENDVAILQIIDTAYVPTYAATLAPDDYKLQRGETIYVVGNPGITFDNSLTKGIVSATERTLTFGEGKKVKAFQIDAVAIGGNSGGSVLNEQGQIVGTLDAGLRGAGINFVVPIAATKKLLSGKGYKDPEGAGVGMVKGHADERSGTIGPMRTIHDNGVAPLKFSGDAWDEVIHMDTPRATLARWPLPTCWTPELVQSWIKLVLPASQIPAVIPLNGTIGGPLPWMEGHNWSMTFRDGCATNIEVKRAN